MPRRSKRVVRFSKEAVEGLVPPAKGVVEWWDESTPNLSCRIYNTGSKTFYWVGRTGGEWQRVMLGVWPIMNVSGARTEAARLSGQAAVGAPTVARRKGNKGVWTLEELYKWYMETHSKPYKRTWKWDESQWERRFTRWAKRKVTAITKIEVQAYHLSIAEESGPYAANKMLEQLGHMYKLGHEIDKTAVPCESPTQGIKRFPREERERFLDSEELPKWIAAVETLKRQVSRDFMMLCLWTGARRQNVCSMRWDEISMTDGVWVIPKEKSKNKKPMNVVLSPPALEILKRRGKDSFSDWVLPGGGPTGHYNDPKAALAQVRKVSGLSDIRTHDLRRTLGSWMAIDNTLQMIGKQLGHSSLKATAIYARLATKAQKKAVGATAAAMGKKPKKTGK